MSLLPPNATLRNRPGAPSAHQLELSTAQMASKAAAHAPAAQSQMLSGVQESLKATEMVPDSQKNLASNFLYAKLAGLKGMAGVTQGAEAVAALGNSPAEVMAKIGMVS